MDMLGRFFRGLHGVQGSKEWWILEYKIDDLSAFRNKSGLMSVIY